MELASFNMNTLLSTSTYACKNPSKLYRNRRNNHRLLQLQNKVNISNFQDNWETKSLGYILIVTVISFHYLHRLYSHAKFV